ncbi:hypothetical protein ICN42_02050 [Polynucleobacter sp. 71A-WALBACH]|uniref:hypothetical protein n=1 Tax=Polynucleobacter sp. 71A-WALBACH TaxID=2689097 RepID=UPI001C0E119D|nr:hypothetical protein [Polynucleobacter sp. 71A-WALBACH]MBU3592881.1 hypothetical protein [Polynucleobacter sp. 71A-WALBACH]
MKSTLKFSFLVGCLFILALSAQNSQAQQKAQMQYVATFEAGQPGAGIYKLYDQSDDVICYILMPETASRKQVDNKWVYESNSLGSISCIKANSLAKSAVKK